MSDCFEKHFTAIRNYAKPSLHLIIDHSFEVVKRMDTVCTDRRGSYFKSQTFAQKVDYVSNESNSYKSNAKFNFAYISITDSLLREAKLRKYLI